jgi:hypothetical protein
MWETLTKMRALKRLRGEDVQSSVRSEIAKHLHAEYDHVVKEELPPRLEKLVRRIDERLH